jgi:hypothetical protein
MVREEAKSSFGAFQEVRSSEPNLKRHNCDPVANSVHSDFKRSPRKDTK